MSTIMMRSFAECLGVKWPREIALLRSEGRFGELTPVTWAQVHAERRARQADVLDRIRTPAEPEIVPCYVWTFFNAQDIPYHGWYCYVVARQFEVAVNFRGFKSALATSIMTALPLGLQPVEENFEAWMAALAQQHRRKRTKNDPRRAGSVIGWLSHRSTFSLTRPNPA